MQPKIHGAYQPFIGDLIARKIVQIDTKGSVEFDLRSDLKLTEEYERELQMDVLFTEAQTDRIQAAQSTITIRRSQYKITKISRINTFEDDESFELIVQVSRHDGNPIRMTDVSADIELSYSPALSFDKDVHTETARLDKDGRVKISWLFPGNQSAGYYVKVRTEIAGEE